MVYIINGEVVNETDPRVEKLKHKSSSPPQQRASSSSSSNNTGAKNFATLRPQGDSTSSGSDGQQSTFFGLGGGSGGRGASQRSFLTEENYLTREVATWLGVRVSE
eukprot:GHVQ01015171.1.p1 GENE.GHVQ01015171.1~~GHVQ01015171.1.p1  ORF type:complete len:106 (-),score=22.72 GHVQ01015171.1:695-1012(-)